MEAGSSLSPSFDITPLKEPRGFIKVIQWILSIFAFATTTSLTTQIAFTATCPNTTDVVTRTAKISYNFNLEDVSFGLPLCQGGNTSSPTQALLQGSKAAAEFYVFVGVIVFLYCLVALAVYLLFDDFYRRNPRCTVGDLIASVIIVLLWLIGSSAWAQGVTDVKYYTNLQESGVFERILECTSGSACKQTDMGNYASLNVSIIFGFLNMAVWVGNLWFLYKETPWYQVQSKPPTLPGQPSQETDPQKM